MVGERRAFEVVTERLVAAARRTEGVLGLVLLGSTTGQGAERRDGFSDHDFFLVLQPGRERAVRRDLAFLPDPERIVLLAREDIGASVLYDDGHLLEFGAGTLEEIGAVRMNRAEVAVDGPGVAAFARTALDRDRTPSPAALQDAVGLALVQLRIGAGRAARGEAVSGGVRVRAHAVAALALALRLRDGVGTAGDSLDPLRRLEQDAPGIAGRIADAVARRVPDAADALLDVLRDEFGDLVPAAAAALVEDAIAAARGRPGPGD